MTRPDDDADDAPVDRRRRRGGGPPIKFIVEHLVAGTLGALALSLVLLYADVGGLKELMWQSPDRWLYLALFYFGLWITCGSVALAIGIVTMGSWREPPVEGPRNRDQRR